MALKESKNVVGLIAALALPLATGGLSAWLTKDGMRMYALMDKPPFSPPGWVFPAVWTVLYVLMGIASYLVCTSGASAFRRKRALTAYALQLAVNFLWPLLFFGLEMYLAAFICLLILTVFVFVCTVFFYHISKTAGWFFVPYLIWCIFALYLNFGTYLLN